MLENYFIKVCVCKVKHLKVTLYFKIYCCLFHLENNCIYSV